MQNQASPETQRSPGNPRPVLLLVRFTIDGVNCLAYSYAQACKLVRGDK